VGVMFAIWKWVQRFNPRRLYCCKRISIFLIDETMLQIGTDSNHLGILGKVLDNVFKSQRIKIINNRHFLLCNI
jgi:hypothetical protein